MKRYKLINNTSKVYSNGSTWQSNNCGEFKIVAKTDRCIIDKRGYKECRYYLCEFDDSTIVEAKSSQIKIGKVRNPNHPSIRNIGFLGEGKWKFYINKKATREYFIFSNIIERCYSPSSNRYSTYGAEGIRLDDELHNFQNFCEMLTQAPNYDKWLDDKKGEWELDKDILCEELGIYPKIYSRDTCQFVKKKDNAKERNQRASLTGHTYIGLSPNGVEYEFNNIRQFSREHNLQNTSVGRCARGKGVQHRGWTFKIKH